MSPEVASRIFEPFFTTKSKPGNLGLGLAVVNSLVKGHGGHIDVESVLGRGTTFRVCLPALVEYPLRDPLLPAPSCVSA